MYIVDNKSKESYCLVCANEVSTKQILILKAYFIFLWLLKLILLFLEPYLILPWRSTDSTMIFLINSASPPSVMLSPTLAVLMEEGSGLSSDREDIIAWASMWSAKNGGLHMQKSNWSELPSSSSKRAVLPETFLTVKENTYHVHQHSKMRSM